jgi:integrase
LAQTLARYGNARRGAAFSAALIESGSSICNRNRIMTGVRFSFRVTLRRHALTAEVWHLKESQKLLPMLSSEDVKPVLAMATSLKARGMLTLSYGCGLRAGEVVRLRAGDIDREQMIIRIEQSKARAPNMSASARVCLRLSQARVVRGATDDEADGVGFEWLVAMDGASQQK